MPAHTPEEVDVLFAQAMSAGDLDAAAALYEPGAALAPEPGKFVHGTAAIREALAGFMAMKPTLKITVKSLGRSDDVALVTGSWQLSGTGADGKPINMTGQSVEVVRRQRDGHWQFVIDNPWGASGA